VNDQDKIALAYRMKRNRISYERIAQRLNVSREWIQEQLCPKHSWSISRAKQREDGERRLREIPPDTRDLTARLMGDPIPGRRALDRIQIAEPID
jgi:hypothetical protein